MNPENGPSEVQRSGRGRKEQEKKEKVKQERAIKPELFQTKKGIRALYENTTRLKLDEYSELNIENTMKKIATVLKNWHSEFVPKYSFDYFLQRCQSLGSQKTLCVLLPSSRPICRRCDGFTRARTNGRTPSSPYRQRGRSRTTEGR